MRATWSALHHSLIRHLSRTTSEHQFQMMRQQFPGLKQFSSIAAVMEHQRATTVPPDMRYQTIRILVTAAQADAPSSSVAQMMVVVALWPGLDAVLGRLARGFPAERDVLPSEILARLSEGIAALNLAAVTAVTATLIRNVERDIRRGLIANEKRARSARCIDDPEIEAAATRCAASTSNDGIDVGEYLAMLPPADAALLKRIFCFGQSREQAGKAMGLTKPAACKRVQRAIHRLHTIAEIKSPHPVPLGPPVWPLTK